MTPMERMNMDSTRCLAALRRVMVFLWDALWATEANGGEHQLLEIWPQSANILNMILRFVT